MLRTNGLHTINPAPDDPTVGRVQPEGVPSGSITMSAIRTTPPAASDAELSRALRRDFDSGFTELVRAHQPGIYAGALRLMWRRETAEDIAQDTFLRAYRALSEYSEDRLDEMAFRPWLWTIALNLCRNHATRTPRTHPLPDTDRVGIEDVEPFDDDHWRAALDQLSDPQRTAVVLRHVADVPVAEIADATGRPVGTVKSDISRGLDRLRTIIEPEVRT
jgi:RNA polymerase sigma factor (sigma-70 family)